MKEQHHVEIQSQQKLVDNQRRTNSSFERDSTQSKRDLQSCQQCCSALEKLSANRDSEHSDTLKEVLHRATEAEIQLETSQMSEKELKSNVTVLEEKLSAIQLVAKDKEVRHIKVIGGLQTELLSLCTSNTKHCRLEFHISKRR